MFSRDPLRNPEILKPKTYSITRTVVRQVITFFLGLLIGLGTTYFLTWVANHHTIQFTDGSTTGFGLYGGVTFVIFCISLIGGIYWQHENSASPVRVRQTWKYHILVISFFSGPLTLLGLLMTELVSVVLIVLYQIALILHLSLTIVNVQGFVLKRMAFHENDHRWLMSSEANLWACKAGVWPYRQMVSMMWIVLFSAAGTLFFSAVTISPFVAGTMNDDSGAYFAFCLFLPSLAILCSWFFITTLNSLRNTRFWKLEGTITKSMKLERSSRSPDYLVHCQELPFLTDRYLWLEMHEKKRYQLWYAVVGTKTKVVAFEELPEPQPVIKPVSMPQKAGCLPKLFQPERRGRDPKRSKLPESH